MGLEFSKNDIRPIFKIAVWGTFAQVALTLCAGTFIAWILGKTLGIFEHFSSMMLFATAFVSTSTAVILKTLSSKNQMGTLSSKVMIGMSIVQDLTVIPLMLIVGKLGNLSSGTGAALRPLILGAVFMILMMTLGAKWVPRMLQSVAKLNSKELFMLAVTGIALAAGFLSDAMQVSFSFGAFLAGIVLSDSEYGKKALSELMPVRDLFAMLFFVSIGMMLDCNYLIQKFPLVLLLLFLTSFIRTSILALTTWFAGYRNVIPFAMFFGMVPTSEIAFVVIQAGKQDGLFSGDVYSLILCIVVCSMIAGPALDNLTAPVYKFSRKYIFRNSQKMNNFVMPPPTLSDHIIIVGGGAVARSIAKLLTTLKLPYIIVESDYKSFQDARKEKLTVLYGDPQSEIILEAARVSQAKLLLAAFAAFPENLAVIKAAREINGKIAVVTHAEFQEEIQTYHECQVNEIIEPAFEASLEMTRQILLNLNMPVVDVQNCLDGVRYDHYRAMIEGSRDFSIVTRMRTFLGLVQLYWVSLPKNSPLANHSIAESNIRSRTGSSIAGILRGDAFLSNPDPSDKLFEGDILAMIGNQEQRNAFERISGA